MTISDKRFTWIWNPHTALLALRTFLYTHTSTHTQAGANMLILIESLQLQLQISWQQLWFSSLSVYSMTPHIVCLSFSVFFWHEDHHLTASVRHTYIHPPASDQFLAPGGYEDFALLKSFRLFSALCIPLMANNYRMPIHHMINSSKWCRNSTVSQPSRW